MKPRFSAGLTLAATALLYPPTASAQNSRQLLPFTIPPLPLGAITPGGWLRGELQTMAAGLAGHEHDFYPYVTDSKWLGGSTDYSVLNEALPYWFNGLVPLAYVLGDERLKRQVHGVAAEVLRRQGADGWIGPEAKGADRNFWGRTPFLLGLTQLAEGNATGWHGVVVDAAVRYFRLAHEMLRNDGEGYTQCEWNPVDCSWGQVRVHDTIMVVQWLLENAELKAEDEVLLWETMDMLYDMSKFKWEDWYTEGKYEKVIGNPSTNNALFPYIHGVNVGQGLKSSAVIRRFTHRESLLNTTFNGVDWTFKYKGAASGTILADEIQRDLAPFMGSELCTAVETGYSLAYLYHALGTNSFADRAELVIFNALPTMVSHDMWSHQYMTRPNGPWALNQNRLPSLFTTANGVATIFGLEPQYPCCTVNFPQGYPKFLANSWGRADKGLVHALLSPSTVDTTVPKVGRVVVKCETEYPFSNRLRYIVNAESDFDLYLRFPSWGVLSKSFLSLSADGAAVETLTMSPNSDTGLLRVSVPKGESVLEYYIDSTVRVEQRERADGAVSVYVGNVLYALDVGGSITTTLPHRYWDLRGKGTEEFSQYENVKDNYYNFTKPWNVAIDPSSIEYHRDNTDTGIQRGFSALEADRGPTNYLTVQGCEIDWPVREGVAPDVPPKNPTCVTERQTYRMIPYGLAKIHMSELPVIKPSRRRGTKLVPGKMRPTEGAVDPDGPGDL